ncbi:hypothetical protein [Cellvibrio sp. NN19]|uniref:hypothetical protein n=1 Tax=Cellvibrio chitinivorans TaxID=3102792 RepID=UPI002B4129BD|nr:hypothetical protein [Cellvibrio sp. NN19]
MESNPYKTPNSDVAVGEIFKRSIWWKIYFFFITIISTIGIISILFQPNAGISEYINLVLWLMVTVGLFGFTFLKPIYKPNFWLHVLMAYLIYSFAYYFITDIDLRMGMSNIEFYTSTAVGLLLSIPTYYGLFAFSRPTDPAWKIA